MLSSEPKVQPGSDYYLYTASLTARELLLYPSIVGHFAYEPGYLIHRQHFDNFLLMLIEDGVCDILLHGNQPMTARRGDVVLIDCYAEHQYGTQKGFSCLWMHFDGRMARSWYEHIISRFGNVIRTPSGQSVSYHLGQIYRLFQNGKPAKEPRMSTEIELILAALLDCGQAAQSDHPGGSDGVQNAIAYISAHFAEPLQLQTLADQCSLSPYYFSRLFAKETGMTPHQYILETRIASARYYLSTTNLSVKEIAYLTGFTDESSFCSTFRKREGETPSSYRNSQSASH